jgi:hypothetical protein
VGDLEGLWVGWRSERTVAGMEQRWILRVASILLTVGLAFAVASGWSARASTPGSDASSASWHHLDPAGEPVVHLWFGYSSTCPHCRDAAPFVEALDARPWIEVVWLQVDGPDADAAVATVSRLADTIGQRFEAVPTFLFGGRMLVGWADAETTGERLEAGLEAYREHVRIATAPAAPIMTAPPAEGDTSIGLPLAGEVDAATLSLPLLAVVLGGLDAFNPCALAVLLFLLGILAGSRDRRRMLLIGAVFVGVSGVVYFALMAAWLNAFLVVGALRWVTLLAGVAAVVAALINIKDHVWFRRGASLTLPERAKPQLFGRILDLSDETRLRVLLATTVLVAAIANTYEMLCTGGFPVVFTRVITLADLSIPAYYGYLALYCLVYVVPAALIVTAFTLTLGSRSVSEREARDLKLLSGLLMLGFGSLLLLAPDRLMDLGTTVGLFAGVILAWIVIVAVERWIARDRVVHGGT